MRVGFLTVFDTNRLEFAKTNGFGSIELLFSSADFFYPGAPDWEQKADEIRGHLADLDIRISCLGGFYHNNLEPEFEEKNAAHIRATIELANRLGVDRVAGFAGRWPIDAPLEDSMPRYEEFWKPLAEFAADHGVRVAFEHCPMGTHHLPPGGINMACTPSMWEHMFEPAWADAFGIEWDASHLLCQRIDPVLNIHLYGDRIVHVHAKDAKVERHIYDRYGIYHPGAIEHCFPGLGDADWPAIVKALYRCGYDSDLSIEGWHDAVYCNHGASDEADANAMTVLQLEDTGLLLARDTLMPLVDGR